MHRDLRILDLRAGDDSPLRTLFLLEAQNTFSSHWLPTPRHPQSGHNGTSPTPSPPFIAGCSSRSPAACHAAHAAHAASRERCAVFYDTVRLARPPLLVDSIFRAARNPTLDRAWVPMSGYARNSQARHDLSAQGRANLTESKDYS